jgi:hypothetical protein
MEELNFQAEKPEQHQSAQPKTKDQEETEDYGVEVKPTIVAQGCNNGHYFVEDWEELDDNAMQHVICTKSDCWCGAYYDPSTQKLEDGKIINIKE